MRVEVNGVGLEVQISGEGPDVLLLHGFPDTHALWRHQVAALNAAGYRTIAPDLRGFGASDKPDGVENYQIPLYIGDLLAVLDAAGAPTAHVVGHDWGAGLALMLAGFAPDRVTSVAIMSVGHILSIVDAGLEQREKSWYMLLFQFPEIAEAWLSQNDFANTRDLLATHPEPDEVLERLRDPAALSGCLGLYRNGAHPGILVERPVLPPVSAPVLGVWSSGDLFLTEQSMTGTEKHVAGPWRYERLEGVGHWIPLEAPEKVNELLLDHLRRFPRGADS